ncbi:hypothetical protein AB0F20_10055 [Streptomyces goshikiensis]|uniref:hypothetical protein n=1 Tax=Streptomyces goshikiensis TaxID=1942 RepID=UPI0033C163C5
MPTLTEYARTSPPQPDHTSFRPELSRDIATALGLADFSPTGPTTGAVVGRLRESIKADLEDAQKHAVALGRSTRARDVALGTVKAAADLLMRPCHDPAAKLRLHAKYAEHVHRYAIQHRARAVGA